MVMFSDILTISLPIQISDRNPKECQANLNHVLDVQQMILEIGKELRRGLRWYCR